MMPFSNKMAYFVLILFAINVVMQLNFLAIASSIFYLIYFLFLLIRYRFYPTIPVLAGGTLNQVAVLSNGFKMPVVQDQWAVSDYMHSVLTSNTHFKPLCDIYTIMGGHLILSIGDIIMITLFPIVLLIFFIRERRKRPCSSIG